MMCMDTRCGINIRKWCLAHETYIGGKLSSDISDAERIEVAKLHERRLTWLMHERLVHLIVMCLTAVLVMFSMAIVLFLPETMAFSIPLFLISFVLLIFYVRHYFFLENTVQKWYMLYDKVNDKCGNPCDEALPGDDAQ